MTLLLCILYIVVLIIPLVRKKRDFFAPPVLFSATMCFYTLPDVFAIMNIGADAFSNQLPFRLQSAPEFVIHRFLILQTLFVLSYFWGYKAGQKTNLFKRDVKIKDATNKRLNLIFALCGLALATYITLDFINKIGGFQALFLSFTDRDQLAESKTFFQQTAPIIITMSTAFCIKYLSQCNKTNWYLLVLLIIIGFVVQTSGGGRSDFVVFLFSILCYYNYLIKRLNLFEKKFIPFYLGLALFVVVFQLLRFEDTKELSLSVLMENSDALFDSMSYVKTQIVIQNYFENHTFWLGRIYSFLIYIFIPHSICPNKPFIDEGGYIYNMTINNSTVDVLQNLDFYNSWPPFTAGISYANGGVMGLMLGGLILGFIHSFMYKSISRYKTSIFYLIVYVFVILKFQLTVFYICNVIYLLIEVFLVYKLYKLANKNYKFSNT